MRLIKKLNMRKVGTQKKRWGLFYCEKCGKSVERRLQHGAIQKTCGCNNHGLSHTNEWKVWCGIKRRCYNKNEEKYHRYGGRGIKVCDSWKNDFLSFKDWCDKNDYIKGYHIDRIDNDGNYEPDNCRFIHPTVSARNKSTCVLNLKLVRQIRKLWNFNLYNYKEIGTIFEVDPSLIRQIILGKIWKEGYE